MKSSRLRFGLKYVGVFLWHGIHSVLPLFTSSRSSGNKANGLMWSACNLPPRILQCWQVKSSLVKTLFRHVLYGVLPRIRTFLGVIPPFHIGCSCGGRARFLCRSSLGESRITVPNIFSRLITHGRDNPTRFPTFQAGIPSIYRRTISASSTWRLLLGTHPFLNSVCIEARLPRWASLFFILASRECRLPFMGLRFPRCFIRFASITCGLCAASLPEQLLHFRCRLSDLTNSTLAHPEQILVTMQRVITSESVSRTTMMATLIRT